MCFHDNSSASPVALVILSRAQPLRPLKHQLDFHFWRARVEGRALSKRNGQINFLTYVNIIWVMYVIHHISLHWPDFAISQRDSLPTLPIGMRLFFELLQLFRSPRGSKEGKLTLKETKQHLFLSFTPPPFLQVGGCESEIGATNTIKLWILQSCKLSN